MMFIKRIIYNMYFHPPPPPLHVMPSARKLARMQFIRLNMDPSSSGDGGGEDLKLRPSTVPGSTPTQGSVVDVQRSALLACRPNVSL